MKKKNLVCLLRQQHIDFLNSLSSDDIITSSILCDDCGDPMLLLGKARALAIQQAEFIEEFLELCLQFNRTEHRE